MKADDRKVTVSRRHEGGERTLNTETDSFYEWLGWSYKQITENARSHFFDCVRGEKLPLSSQYASLLHCSVLLTGLNTLIRGTVAMVIMTRYIGGHGCSFESTTPHKEIQIERYGFRHPILHFCEFEGILSEFLKVNWVRTVSRCIYQVVIWSLVRHECETRQRGRILIDHAFVG